MLVEVKSERNVKARSLAEYRKKYASKYAVKTSMKSDTNGTEILNIPPHMISRMRAFME